MADEDTVRPLFPHDKAFWAEVDEEDRQIARESAQAAASACDLCTMLRWHRATMAGRIMVVDEEERRTRFEQYHAALGQAREALIAYYELPPELAEDDEWPQGAPPTCADPHWPGYLLHAELQVRTEMLEQESKARAVRRQAQTGVVQPAWLARLLGRG